MPVPNRKRAPRHLTIKVLVLGQPQVGKSATIVRFLTHRFIGKYSSNKDWLYRQPLSYHPDKNLTTSIDVLEQTTPEPQASDDVNQSRLHEYRQQLRDRILWADAYIVMYAINDRASFVAAIHHLDTIGRDLDSELGPVAGAVAAGGGSSSGTSKWLATKQPHSACEAQLVQRSRRPVLLLANKSDLLREARKVDADEGHSLASLHQCLFAEISAADSHLGICNTIRALLAQANSRPNVASKPATGSVSSSSSGGDTASSGSSGSSSGRISRKLNSNLHNRYDTIKSSFRRASLAIILSKTFAGHHSKHSESPPPPPPAPAIMAPEAARMHHRAHRVSTGQLDAAGQEAPAGREEPVKQAPRHRWNAARKSSAPNEGKRDPELATDQGPPAVGPARRKSSCCRQSIYEALFRRSHNPSTGKRGPMRHPPHNQHSRGLANETARMSTGAEAQRATPPLASKPTPTTPAPTSAPKSAPILAPTRTPTPTPTTQTGGSPKRKYYSLRFSQQVRDQQTPSSSATNMSSVVITTDSSSVGGASTSSEETQLSQTTQNGQNGNTRQTRCHTLPATPTVQIAQTVQMAQMVRMAQMAQMAQNGSTQHPDNERSLSRASSQSGKSADGPQGNRRQVSKLLAVMFTRGAPGYPPMGATELEYGASHLSQASCASQVAYTLDRKNARRWYRLIGH